MRPTGEQETALWSAANQWAHVYTLAKYRTKVTVEMVATAMRADECAAEGGYDGPWGAQELVKLAEPEPAYGPRMAITHLGYIEVPDGFDL